MASIDELLANSAKVDPSTFDFGGIVDSYRKGQDWKYQQDLRNAFKDNSGNFRQDLLDDKGNPDSGKMYQRLMTIGGAPVADAASKLAETGFQQDRYRNAPTVEGVLRGDLPQPLTTNYPPSANRGAPAAVAPPLNRGGIVQPQAAAPAPGSSQGGGDKPGSLMGFLSNWGVPDELAGSEMNILGGKLSAALGRRIDPNQPMDMKDPNVRGVLSEWVRARGGRNGAPPAAAPAPDDLGAPQQPVVGPATGRNSVSIDPTKRAGMGTPQPAAYGSGPQPVSPQMLPPLRQQSAPAQAALASSPQAITDPTLGGLVPAGYEPGAYVRRLEAVAGSGRVLPDQLKVLQARIEGIRKALEPTQDMKNARASGLSLTDYQNRSDDNMAQRDVLTKSILPKLDASQEKAMAARDDIDAIHRSREQLDQKGGVFSGAFADKKLFLAKVVNMLGVPNADKITNSESYGAAIGQRVAMMIKAFGSGTAISDGDRKFTAAMAGGQITLDENSMRRILDIGERAARGKIDQHNGLADRTLKSTEALKGYGEVYRVQQPGQYQRIGAAPPPKAGDIVDGHRFLGGNPRDQRSWGTL